MLHWVEGDATQAGGCAVAKIVGHVAVCGFVHSDSKQYGQGIDHDGLDQVLDIHGGYVLKVEKLQTDGGQVASALAHQHRVAASAHLGQVDYGSGF